MAKKKDAIPEDIDAELKSPKFGKPKTHSVSGYILDINETDKKVDIQLYDCLLYTSPSPRDGLLSRMPSSA